MTVPARRPVDDALGRLDAALLRWAQSEWHEDYPAAVAALATVRSELERLREERDAAHRTAAVECERAEAAEAEVRRLTEGLRDASERLGELTQPPWLDNTPLIADVRDNLRALLAASPSDGAALARLDQLGKEQT